MTTVSELLDFYWNLSSFKQKSDLDKQDLIGLAFSFAFASKNKFQNEII